MPIIKPLAEDYTQLDMFQLTRELDRVKSDLFTRKFASFYAPLLCSLNFVWTLDIPKAQTDGVNLAWNPNWFLGMPRASRLTVLMHEISHPARLYFDRIGDRIPKVFNYAADIRINNDLEDQGYSFEGIEDCWKDHSYPPGMPEEDIYEDLIAKGYGNNPFLNGPWGGPLGPDDPGDADQDGLLGPMTKEEKAKRINNIIRSIEQSRLAGGDVPGDIETTLNQFLAPVVPWEQYLYRFFTELQDGGYTWSRPNRRHSDMYLPSKFEEEGALSHVAYFEDVSGSISDQDAIRFNSEFKYVKDQFKPKKMTLIQFDTIIQQVLEYGEEDEFSQVTIMGRGGTCLRCVKAWIEEHRPTAVVVFTDMGCAPMEMLSYDVPILWVVIANKSATAPMGQIIHIR